jgi:peptide/nickel transport system substrate-binding protein
MKRSPVNPYGRGVGVRKKAFPTNSFRLPSLALFAAVSVGILFSTGCSKPDQKPPGTLEFLMDQPPVSLNPRSAIDANGQRLNALLFRALTRIDQDLKAVPDLASSWKMSGTGAHFQAQFQIDGSPLDHELEPITAEKMALCLENYRIGKPVSPYLAAFPNWTSTEYRESSVILHFSKPDPYLLRNISLLRYFRVEGQSQPCTEPKQAALVTSGSYFVKPWVVNPESEMMFQPETRLHPQLRPLHVSFIEDDNTRILKLLRGEIDATQNTLTVAKEHWLAEKHPDQFTNLLRVGVVVSYMAFNVRDPILKDKRIRQAITLAIDRDAVVQNKMFGFGMKAGSILFPDLPESSFHVYEYNVEKARQLLAEAGYSVEHPLALHYKTTPVREGFEQGLVFKDMLGKIGIDLIVDMVEPAVFTASVKTGKFQIYSSRWLGVADASILYRTLYSKSPDNRTGYSNAEVDRLLDLAVAEMDDVKRAELMKQVQEISANDLPSFPLWFWGNGLLYRKDAPFFSGLKSENVSLSGALEPMLVQR